MTIFRLIGFRHMRLKPLRSVLTMLGVAFGVALFTAIEMINSTTLENFKESVGSVAGKAALTVYTDEAGFPEDRLEVVKKVQGVKYAVPLVQAQVYFQEGDKTQSIVILGIDLLSESSVRTYRTSDQNVIEDPLTFLNQPDSVILTRVFAAAHGLKIDSVVQFMTAKGKQSFTVRGLLNPEGPARAFGGGLAVMDIDGARLMFGKDGKTDRIDIVPQEGADVNVLAHRISLALGPGFKVDSPGTQTETLTRMVEGYQGLLSFVSLLSLLAGIVLVGNSVGVSISERRGEIGVLRALGATRKTVLTNILLECLVLGVVGALLGLAMGRGLASSMTDMISVAISTQYSTPIHIHSLKFEPSHFIHGLVIGAFAAVLAGIWPAIQATRIGPIEAIRGKGESEAGAAETSGKKSRFRFLGILMLGLLGLDSYFSWSSSYPIFRVLGPYFIIFGSLLGSPWLVTALIRGVRRLAVSRKRGVGRFILRLSAENLLRSPKRTGSNVMTLMVGLMLVIVIATMNESMKQSLTQWFYKILSSDLVVSSRGRLVALQVTPLHESLGQEINQVPGVDVSGGVGATAWRAIKLQYEGRMITLKAYDPPHPTMKSPPFEVIGRDADAIDRKFFSSNEPVALISENFVRHFFGKGVGPGGAGFVEIPTPNGNVRFKVIGEVAEFSSPEGVICIPRSFYKKFWADSLVTSFYVQVEPGASVDGVMKEINSRMGAKGVLATSNAELREEARRLIDENFAYTRAIEFSALLIGLLGLFNTLLVSVLERSQELGTLRAVGMSARQLGRMILAEAFLQGALGGLVAVSLGAYVSYVWVVGNLSEMLGWSVQFSFPWESVLTTLGSGLAVGLLGGWIPAKRAARRSIVDSLGYE